MKYSENYTIEKQFLKIKNNEIKLKVICHNRPNLRSDLYEIKYNLCYGILMKIFEHFVIDSTIQHVELYFPERHLNILEQRALLSRILFYFPNIINIYIETHSPFILQTIPNGHVFVYRYNEELVKETNEVNVKLYNNLY